MYEYCMEIQAAEAFLLFSSTMSTLSIGIPCSRPAPDSIMSYTSSLTSPCTTISSCPCGFFVTDEPVANLPANCFAAFFKSTPNASRPCMDVICFRLLRSIRLIVIYIHCEYFEQRMRGMGTHLRRHLLLQCRFCLGFCFPLRFSSVLLKLRLRF